MKNNVCGRVWVSFVVDEVVGTSNQIVMRIYDFVRPSAQ